MHCRFPAWLLSSIAISFLIACSSVTIENRSATDQSVETCSQECLSGNCSNGEGVFQFSDCSRYEGGFKDGLRHGQGTFAYSSGAVLKGEFRQGRPTGKFRYLFPDGATFDGVVADEGMKQTDHGFQIDRAKGTLKEGEVSRACDVEGMRLICSATASTDTAPNQDTSEFPNTKTDIDANQVRFLILYAPNTAFLTRNGKQYSIAAGYPLLPGDLIETRQHAADIQGEGGFAIRLKPFSSLFIPENARSNRVL
ncbi:MAG: hypothetical protein KDK33_07455, partial [Leptospiraceae bacterium]|nr:hypothetical protein [Leptospiraceae bacterium]